MARFGAPPPMDARHLFPGPCHHWAGLPSRAATTRAEGHTPQYPSMGYANINEVYAPTVLHELACLLEDHGWEGAAFRNTGGRMTVSDITGDPHEPWQHGRRIRYSRPVAEDRPAPDVMFHFRIAAFICGLGEIGWSKLFLTPQFGPRQRFAFMLTDAPLEPDPLYDGPPLCDRCFACVRECPVGAISGEESVRMTVAGRELQWGALAEWDCFHGYMGSNRETNPSCRRTPRRVPERRSDPRGEARPSPARGAAGAAPILRPGGGLQLGAVRRARLPARVHGAP